MNDGDDAAAAVDYDDDGKIANVRVLFVQRAHSLFVKKQTEEAQALDLNETWLRGRLV